MWQAPHNVLISGPHFLHTPPSLRADKNRPTASRAAGPSTHTVRFTVSPASGTEPRATSLPMAGPSSGHILWSASLGQRPCPPRPTDAGGDRVAAWPHSSSWLVYQGHWEMTTVPASRLRPPAFSQREPHTDWNSVACECICVTAPLWYLPHPSPPSMSSLCPLHE